MVRPKIGLALGSGGLRGMAHVGVLRVFEQEQIPIDYIAGCSIGSLIGALFCSGLDADAIWKLAKELKRWHWIDLNLPKMGIFSGDRVLETLGTLIKHKDFADLTIPLAIIATDLRKGQEVIFTQGPVASAVRASVSVPGIFVPFEYDGRSFIDGAVMNPTPVDIVRKMGADIIIGVDLTTPGNFKISSIFDVIIQTIDIMERQLLKYQANDCHLLILPKTGHISPSSFDAIDECVALGEQAAKKIMPGLKQLLATPQ
ncbi:MAG: Patatin-like phospholipase [Firmicutes bacterium]|nr:Patatin-like phospholipase [Bacillota bacterium]